MTTQSVLLSVSDSIGSVSAAFMFPAKPVAILTLAHGAGAGMHHAFMNSLAEALAQQDLATLRFNFPYMEHGKKRPDVPAVTHQAIAAAVHAAHEKFPILPVFLSGKSFGGRMSSQYMAQYPINFVKGLIFFGFPLHPPKQLSIERAEHLKKVSVPMLFLQGTRDTLAELNLIESVTRSLSHTTLQKFEGADHSFKKGKENLIPALASAVKEWIQLK